MCEEEIMQPIKLQRMKRTNCWSPARKVWFQKNDDREWEVQEYPSREEAQREKDKDESFGFKTRGRVHKVPGYRRNEPTYFYDGYYE